MFDIAPAWTVEPRVDIIKELALPHLPAADYKIESFASGAFNKLYLISGIPAANTDPSLEREEYLMRLTLLVYPYFKTASEVATLSYLADHTSIPVPHVLAHNSSASNDSLGFEWILMTRLKGVSLKSLWPSPSLTWDDRVELTKTIAGYIDQMRMIHSQLLGSLYFSRDADDVKAMLAAHGQPKTTPFEMLEEDPKFSVGPICDLPFFYGDRIRLASDRGPWSSARAWIEAQIRLQVACARDGIERALRGDSEDPDMEVLSDQLTSAEEFLSFFTGTDDNPFDFGSSLGDLGRHSSKETFVLFHSDLSTNNILIDPTTHIVTGVVDWECTSFVPRWKANQVPKFLDGPDIDSVIYRVNNRGEDIPQIPPPPEKNEDDGSRTDFREELEQMRLRERFMRTSSVLPCPEGYECPSEGEAPWGRTERVVEGKVMSLDSPMMWAGVSDWVERIRQGGPVVLKHEAGQDLYIWPEI